MRYILALIALCGIGVLAFAQVPSQSGLSRHRPNKISHDPNDWPMYNHDARGTRFNTGERELSTSSVQRIQQQWMYLTAGDVYATPAVVDDTVYAGDTSGTVYALTRTGQLLWKSTVNGPITGSALVTNRMVILGDQLGYVYGLDRWSGQIVWSIRPNPNQYAAIYGSPVWVAAMMATWC